MTWDINLEGRGVVVTGGAGGIGREVAAAFASAGARVAVVDIDPTSVEEVVAGLESPERHLALTADLADLQAQEALLRAVFYEFGRLDVSLTWRPSSGAEVRSMR